MYTKKYLYFSVFIAGLTTLATEFTASRIVQSVYGQSNIVWANVIALTLLSLSLGYFIGGRMADRTPRFDLYYRLLTVAGVATVACLLLATFFGRKAATALATLNINTTISSLLVLIIAIGLPIVLLGCVAPFAIRLAVTDIRQMGRISGELYALSTIGSLFGTYLPVLISIPLIGTRLTVLTLGTLLIIVGLFGWHYTQRSRLQQIMFTLLPLVAAPFLLTGGIKAHPDQIYEAESAYNYIAVLERDGCRYLQLNEGFGVHSQWCAMPQESVSLWEMVLAAPYFTADPTVERMAIVGLAAGTMAQAATDVYGDVAIDGIEIDPQIVAIGRSHFNLNLTNLNVLIGDGRLLLNQQPHTYDLIVLDAYRVPYIPWHLTTTEFFAEVKEKLNADGVVVANIGRTPSDRRLIEAMTATMLTQFDTVHTLDVPNSFNTLLIATSSQPSAMSPSDRFTYSLQQLATSIQTALVPTQASTLIFTDDHAPVEWLTDSLAIRYLLENGLNFVEQ